MIDSADANREFGLYITCSCVDVCKCKLSLSVSICLDVLQKLNYKYNRHH